MFVIKCAYCKCDTGASGFISIQRRLDDGQTPIWGQADCLDRKCVCHARPGTTDLDSVAILALRVVAV